jgi:hypothetical protein
LLVLLLAISAITTACGDAGADRGSLAAQYMAIATAGNRHLDADFDALSGRDSDDLDAARADLHDAATTEKTFDAALLALPLPSTLMATARALVDANESRTALTLLAATSATLEALRRYEQRLAAANVPVEQQVRTIRSQLGLPPPATS